MEKIAEPQRKKPLRIERISVKDFGPLKEADIELGDITILTGPQNSGKTILATLIYTLNNTLKNFITFLLVNVFAEHIEEKYGEGEYNEDAITKIITEDINIILKKLEKKLYRQERLITNLIENEIRANYQVAIDTLIKRGAEKSTIQYNDFFTVKFELAKGNLTVQKLSVSVSQDSILNFLMKYIRRLKIKAEGARILSWQRIGVKLIKPRSCFYIPAERIYLLHYLADIVDLVFEVYQRIGSRYEETRKSLIGLKKTVLDYVKELNRTIRLPNSYDLLGVGDVMVKEGVVMFFDKSHDVTIPLHFAGSGISQLVGIVLPLSTMNLDFAVIEEPEINLHADMQLRIAEYLAESSKRKMVQIVLTTHSEHFLAKMAHLYAKGVIDDLRAYYLNPETEKAEELELTRETGEIELPESIWNAIEGLAEESLKLIKQSYKREKREK